MAELTSEPSLLAIRGAPWKGVRYGCTTRRGGVSSGEWGSLNLGAHVGDDPEAVCENRRRLSAGLPGQPFWLEQVHGNDVVEISCANYRQDTPRADAAITTSPGVVLAIMTADCLPVVIADLDAQGVAVAHAGWRGLAGGVLEATFSALSKTVPHARGWQAWIGPSIGQANFEVGDEVRLAFVEQDATTDAWFAAGRRAGKWQADLAGLARHRLEAVGVQSVELAGLCTYERDDLLYSYRRSPVCGRMATLAWLE